MIAPTKADDLMPWKCCGCGAIATGTVKPCDCVTISGYRKRADGGGPEYCIFTRATPPQATAPQREGAVTHTCNAKRNNGPNDPQDCEWPFCECDPYALKVLQAVEESGFTIGRPSHGRQGGDDNDQ